MKNAEMNNLGKQAKDKVTGFKGIAIGILHYLTGCIQYEIQPKVDKNGTYPESRWIDEDRIEFGDQKVENPYLKNVVITGGPERGPR